MIFLTGGTGMLGAHLLLDLSTVRKIFSWYSDEADRLFRQIEWVEGDMLDVGSLREHMFGITTIIHAAAKVSFDPRDHDRMIYENSMGTANMADLALDCKIPRFCHVSSIAALGSQETGFPVNEYFSWQNDRKRSAYSESKFQSEMEVWRGIQEGLQAVIVNPSVILGAGNWNSGSPRLFQTVRDGLKLYTTGSTGFVDARDVSRAIITLVQSGEWEAIKNQRYVISAENHTFREIFDWIAEALNQSKPTFRANRLLLNIGWRASRLVSRFTGKTPVLTRETARSSLKITDYDGFRITGTIDFTYTPIEKTIQEIGKIFLTNS
jgi:dihydroflavonol-4-reductase